MFGNMDGIQFIRRAAVGRWDSNDDKDDFVSVIIGEIGVIGLWDVNIGDSGLSTCCDGDGDVNEDAREWMDVDDEDREGVENDDERLGDVRNEIMARWRSSAFDKPSSLGEAKVDSSLRLLMRTRWGVF